MTKIQQSIEVHVPIHTAYRQLTHFEDYPRFMQDVETVQKVDDTHLHWSTKLSYQTMEWDAEITEQKTDRCISWRNVSGPHNNGKVELQEIGPDAARVTLTMECEPNEILVAPDGNTETVMAQRLEQDLARFKAFVEEQGTPTPTSSYAAGSEGWDGSEDPAEPVVSAGRNAQATTSPASLSGQEEDGRYSVAEEQNFDQQSDQARRVGQMPQEAADAMAKPEEKEKLRQAMDRAVPPSE